MLRVCIRPRTCTAEGELMQWFFKPAPLLQLAGTGIGRLDRTPCSRETVFRLLLRSFNRLWIAAEGLFGHPTRFAQTVRETLDSAAKSAAQP